MTGWLAPDFAWETARDEALVGNPYDPEAPYVPLHRKSFRGTDHPHPVTGLTLPVADAAPGGANPPHALPGAASPLQRTSSARCRPDAA